MRRPSFFTKTPATKRTTRTTRRALLVALASLPLLGLVDLRANAAEPLPPGAARWERSWAVSPDGLTVTHRNTEFVDDLALQGRYRPGTVAVYGHHGPSLDTGGMRHLADPKSMYLLSVCHGGQVTPHCLTNPNVRNAAVDFLDKLHEMGRPSRPVLAFQTEFVNGASDVQKLVPGTQGYVGFSLDRGAVYPPLDDAPAYLVFRNADGTYRFREFRGKDELSRLFPGTSVITKAHPDGSFDFVARKPRLAAPVGPEGLVAPGGRPKVPWGMVSTAQMALEAGGDDAVSDLLGMPRNEDFDELPPLPGVDPNAYIPVRALQELRAVAVDVGNDFPEWHRREAAGRAARERRLEAERIARERYAYTNGEKKGWMVTRAWAWFRFRAGF